MNRGHDQTHAWKSQPQIMGQKQHSRKHELEFQPQIMNQKQKSRTHALQSRGSKTPIKAHINRILSHKFRAKKRYARTT